MWKCSNCNTEVSSDSDEFCWFCGTGKDGSPPKHPTNQELSDEPVIPTKVSSMIAGVLIGGFIGFLLRPSAPLAGQLDFWTVISRGTNLRGLDQMFISVAETSFNYLFVFSIIGGAIGGWLGYLLTSRKKQVSASNEMPVDLPINKDQAGSINNKQDIAARLKSIAELRNDGILTEEEFQSKKKELLDQI